MNHNLAEYHVPVSADIYDMEVVFVEEHDDIVNPLGTKGLGEIGSVRRQQSGTRSTTRPESELEICRLRLINCSRKF